MLRNRLRLVVRPKKTIEPKNYTIANKTTKKNRRRLRLGNSIFRTKRRNVFLANPPDVRSNWDIFERIRNEHSNDDNMQTRILDSKLRCPLIRLTYRRYVVNTLQKKNHLERLISYRIPGLFSSETSPVEDFFPSKTFPDEGFSRRRLFPVEESMHPGSDWPP